MIRLKKYYQMGVMGILAGILLVPFTAQAATFQGNNGALAYVQTSDDGRTSIWRVNQDGSGKTMLVDNAMNPTWSPDGQKVAYIAKRILGDRLYTMNADGTNRMMRTYMLGASEYSPAWSYDGSQIAVAREVKGIDGATTASAVVAVNSTGIGERTISGWSLGARYDSPSWSPNNQEVVYEKDAGSERHLYVKNLSTSSERLLTTLSDDVSSQVAWSPNGNKILFNDTANEVYTIWADGTHRTVISDGESFAASWSPDGSKIAFLEDKSGDEISISQPDGTIEVLPIAKDSYRGIDEPVWSPDGTQLAFTLVYADANTRVADLFSVTLNDGTQKMNLATGSITRVSWQAL